MRIAINGFGRIGKTLLRSILSDPEASKQIEVATINIGKGNIDAVAHTFKYDTIMGTWEGKAYVHGNMLVLNDKKIEIIAELDPSKINWHTRSIDWAVDASGHFTERSKAMLHINSGAKHVLITAPAQDPDITIIPGINDSLYDSKKNRIVSLGSCTTNALIPMIKIIDDAFTITNCMMTTVHAYTNSQVLLDIAATDDPRRSRAAALNIIPTTTGVTEVVDSILPGMGQKFRGMALRVPVAKVSFIDLVCVTKASVTIAEVNTRFKQAATDMYASIVGYTAEPLVSSDFSHDPHSVIIDSLLTTTNGSMIKACGWYDNEWGYCQRLKDFLMNHGN